jgi:hypothetical protein
MTDKTAAQIVADLEKVRAERAKAAEAAADAQRVVDLTAVLDLEEKHGASGVKVIRLPYSAGLPTLIVVRRAFPAEHKRYRAQQKMAKGGSVDMGAINAAAETVADLAVVYPDAETYLRVRETFGGIHAQAGLAAIKLAEGTEDEAGKD